jgi:hypothetical protein
MNVITKFIADNNLDFSGSGSGLNSSCVIISGFALWTGITEPTKLLGIVDKAEDISSDAMEELMRVFKYAKNAGYGKAWDTAEYKAQYTYESKTI